jgi:hypothetical protein
MPLQIVSCRRSDSKPPCPERVRVIDFQRHKTVNGPVMPAGSAKC